MIVIESKKHERHQPNWVFSVGKNSFYTKDVPARIAQIKKELLKDKRFQIVPAKAFPESHIRKLHPYHDYIKNVCAATKDKSFQHLPDIYPGIGFKYDRKVESPFWMGFYCSSAVTPLMKHTYAAAKGSVDAALTGASLLKQKKTRQVYALCRPPGHHAGPRVFGGYCYFNNVAVAADYLSRVGRVAILDIDHHHGDGTQEHFIHRKDVFVCSIHGNPKEDFPYITGYKSEQGLGKGKGANKNFPIPLETSINPYLKTLERAKRVIRDFQPDYLIVAAGFDTFVGDPVGHSRIQIRDFPKIGRSIAQLGLPTLICQEGGYNLKALGKCAHGFLSGFLAPASSPKRVVVRPRVRSGRSPRRRVAARRL